MRAHRTLIVPIALALLLGSATLHAHEDERPGTAGDEQLGKVDFPISCGAGAQAEFNRAVAILHSFYYPDAVKSFTRITEVDPDCAIGYWGIAMNSWYPLWYPPGKEALLQGSAALERAGKA